MIRASVVVVLILTVLIATGLRWREEKRGEAPKHGFFDIVGRTKHSVNRYVTAAALAVVVTVVVMGGLQWLRLWNQS